MTEIGPGSGPEFFAELDSWDLFPEDGDSTIMNCEPEEALEFAEALRMSAPFVWRRPTKPFSFVASSSLHGCVSPYWNIDRRQERARHLARFAALYADQVIIPDPLSVIFEHPRPLTARIELVDNLLMLKTIRPLVEAGVVVFGPTDLPVCTECKRLLLEREDEYADRYRRVVAPIRDEFSQRLRYTITNGDDLGNAELLEFIENGFGSTLGDAIAHLGVDGLVGPPERVDLVTDLGFDLIVNDLHYQALMSSLCGCDYLTARPLDAQVLQAVAGKQPATTKTVDALMHAVPYLEGMDTELLLKLRREEGEAFQLYRERVSQAAREAAGEDESRAQEIFADLVRPELARLDAAVANARKMAARRVRENLIFGTGLVAVGLGAGIVAPNMQAILAALGGLKFGTEVLKGLNELISEPPEVRNSDLYFLWRTLNV